MLDTMQAFKTSPISLDMPQMPGFTVREVPVTALIQVAAFRPSAAAVQQSLASAFGVPDLRQGRAVASADGSVCLSWAGPDMWWLTSESLDPSTLMQRAQAAVTPQQAALVDLSHARCCLRLTGDKRFDVLNKSCSLDFAHFEPGDVALTQVEQLAVTLLMVDAETTDMYVFRSFAEAMLHSLHHASAEYAD